MSSLLKIFSFFRKSGKKVKESINKSTEFIDETLDQEYITGAIEKAKEATGQVAQKAGEVFEKSKQGAEEFIESDAVQSMKTKASTLANDITEKGKQIYEQSMENETFKELSDKAKAATDRVSEKGKKLIDKALENEELKSAVDLIKEKTDLTAEKITEVFDGDTEEE